MRSFILVVGSLNMDLVTVTPRHPGIGETIIGQSFATYPGGKGANQAIAAARLGGEVKMAGCVGCDLYGQELLENLAANNVDTSHVRQLLSGTTGVASITVDAHGDNSIIVVPGSNYQISTADVSNYEPVIASAGMVLLQLEIPVKNVADVITLAKKQHVPVILNPAPAQALEGSLLANIDYLIPNASELALLTGMPTDTLTEIRLAAGKMISNGTGRIIVTRGSQGVYYLDMEQEIVLPAFPVTVVDTTAAGDAFIGGFSAAISKGKDIRAAMIMGSAAGALAATKPGAQTSLPDKRELEIFLNEQPL